MKKQQSYAAAELHSMKIMDDHSADSRGKTWEVRADNTVRDPDTEEVLGRLPGSLALLLDSAPELLRLLKQFVGGFSTHGQDFCGCGVCEARALLKKLE